MFCCAVVSWVQWNATSTRGYLCRRKYDPQVSKTGLCSAFSTKSVIEQILELVTGKCGNIKSHLVIPVLKIRLTPVDNKSVITVYISGVDKIGRNVLASLSMWSANSFVELQRTCAVAPANGSREEDQVKEKRKKTKPNQTNLDLSPI